jgi:hypothetical protein
VRACVVSVATVRVLMRAHARGRRTALGRRRWRGATSVASFLAAVLTEIYLCNVCSCQEILRRNGRGQGDQGRATAIAAGGETSFVLVESDDAPHDQTLYSCGFGSYGTLGNGSLKHGQVGMDETRAICNLAARAGGDHRGAHDQN